MFRKLVVAFIRLAAFAFAAYVVVYVPVGRRTLWEHAAAIVRSQPAQEAAEDIAGAGKQLEERVVQQAIHTAGGGFGGGP